MKILVIRHAVAEALNPLALPRQNDAERVLTHKGRLKMEKAGRGLSRLVKRIDLIAHSPLVRARETAKILSVDFPAANLMEVKALEPGTELNAVNAWLDLVTRGDVIALIGHEPDLSSLIGWLCSGKEDAIVRLKKGGAVMLSCHGKPGPGRARIEWVLTPKQLSMLSDNV